MFGSLKISSDIWVMAKESYKTKPYGVRFEKGILEKLDKEQNIKTPQKALNFLSAHYLTAIKEKEELQNQIKSLEAQISSEIDLDIRIPRSTYVKSTIKGKFVPETNIQNFTDDQSTNKVIDTLPDAEDLRQTEIDKGFDRSRAEEKIKELTTQMSHCGTGLIGRQTKALLQKRINQLQAELK